MFDISIYICIGALSVLMSLQLIFIRSPFLDEMVLLVAHILHGYLDQVYSSCVVLLCF